MAARRPHTVAAVGIREDLYLGVEMTMICTAIRKVIMTLAALGNRYRDKDSSVGGCLHAQMRKDDGRSEDNNWYHWDT
jgi:hypothetical protein